MRQWETVRIKHVDCYRPTGKVETFQGRKVLEIDEKKDYGVWVERYKRTGPLHDRDIPPRIASGYGVSTLYEVEGGWRVLIRYFRTSDDKLSSLSLFEIMTPRQVMGHFSIVADEALHRGVWSRSDLGPPDSNSTAAEWDEWRKSHPSSSRKKKRDEGLDGLMDDDDDAGGGDDDYGGDEESGLDTDK